MGQNISNWKIINNIVGPKDVTILAQLKYPMIQLYSRILALVCFEIDQHI